MQKVQFIALNGRACWLSINEDFIESTRQHAIDEGKPTAYVAAATRVVEEPLLDDELCVVIVLPKVSSEAIDHSAQLVTPQVRTRPDGTPVACALLANARVAVNAHALNDAHPLDSGRLTILWIFEDKCTLHHYPYSEETEEWFWAAASVADGHRHEADYGVGTDIDTKAESIDVLEVLDYFLVETTE